MVAATFLLLTPCGPGPPCGRAAREGPLHGGHHGPACKIDPTMIA